MVHNLRIAGTRKVLCTVFLFVSIWRSYQSPSFRPIRIKLMYKNLPVVVIGVLLLGPSKDPDGWDNIVHRFNAFEVEFGWVHFESMLAVKPALWQMFGTSLAVGRAKGPTTLSKYTFAYFYSKSPLARNPCDLDWWWALGRFWHTPNFIKFGWERAEKSGFDV